MRGTKRKPRRLTALGLLLLGLSLPACHGAGPWYRNQDPGSSTTVYRPTYPPPGRNYFISGYGGTDYSPARPRKNVTVIPVAPAAAPVVEDVPAVSVTHGSWDGD